ncbi:hypothetical protein ABZ746_37445 [Streptomyces sp. NPDC020096]
MTPLSSARSQCQPPADGLPYAHWHPHEEYFDPHGFRIMLNALVPNLRNVTWLLQKQKAQLVGFDEWYPRFQQESGSSEIMRWIVKSRNRITKEADLELLSELQIVWQQDWLQRVLGTSSKFRPGCRSARSGRRHASVSAAVRDHDREAALGGQSVA